MRKLEEVYPVVQDESLAHKDTFSVLVSTLLSAQCLDSTVEAVTPALFAAANTPEKMRRLGVPQVRDLISRVWLKDRKAKALVGLSDIICEKHGGLVPNTLNELKSLPGVGHKTASVVMMLAFGKPAFPVDTHIHRLACRWGCGYAKSIDKTEQALKKWFPDPQSWSELNIRLVLFGKQHCPAKNHDMDKCPICSFAATSESRALNKSSPRKFIAPPKHKNPFELSLGKEGAKAKYNEHNHQEDILERPETTLKGNGRRGGAQRTKNYVAKGKKEEMKTGREAALKARKRKTYTRKANASYGHQRTNEAHEEVEPTVSKEISAKRKKSRK